MTDIVEQARIAAKAGRLEYELEQQSKPEADRMAFVGPHLCDALADEIERLRAELSSANAELAAIKGQEPIATIHDDGFWTHRAGKDPLDVFSGRRSLAVYALPVAPADKDAERWKEYAQHQEHCATCGEAVSDCEIGSALRDAAMAKGE